LFRDDTSKKPTGSPHADQTIAADYDGPE